MKKNIQSKLLTLLASVAMLAMVTNCDIINPKKSEDNSLLLAALLLSQNQAPSWSVSLTARLQEDGGGNLAAVNAVTLSQPEVAPSAVSKNLVIPNDPLNLKVFANPGAQAGVGVFNISFEVNRPETALRFDYATIRVGGTPAPNPDNINDYTEASGSSTFSLVVNDADPTNAGQIADLVSTGRTLVIESIRTVRRGSYSLPNPTRGENLCDGRGVGNPVVKQGTISAAETWSGAILLQGTVFADAPITVLPGTVIFGARGSSLFVRGANKLTAIGTATNPICWTSAARPGSRQPGDWGGIVTIGNSGATRTSSTEGTTPQTYGGASTGNSENLQMEYNIVEFGGNEVAPGDELNSISMYASRTRLTNVQTHRGLDDQFEAWGGRADWNQLLATGGLDDDYDLDEGVTGSITNIIGHKYPQDCGGTPSSDPQGFEMDGTHGGTNNVCGIPAGEAPNNNLGRCTNPTISNFTLIGARVTVGEAMRLREGLAGSISNGVAWGFNGAASPANTVLSFTDGSGSFPTTTVTLTNVGFETGKTLAIGGGARTDVDTNVGELPINSLGGTETLCGFSADKPDYRLKSAFNTRVGGASTGEWYKDWTVYRAR